MIRLQAIYDSLKTAEKKAADLLLGQPGFFARASIVEAAARAGCSEATLVRLAKKLGYGGYPGLKNSLLDEAYDSPVHLYGGVSDRDDCGTVVKKVFKASVQALDDTLNVLEMGDYEKTVEALCRAEKLVFCGAGDAATVARSGFQKFFRIGMDVCVSQDIDVLLMAISHLKQNDVIIAISHSGRTKNILNVVKYARSRGIKAISITNYPLSPLAKNSDIVLLTAAFTEHIKGEVMSIRVAELCVLESLYINVLLKRKDELAPNLDRSNRALERNKL